MKDFHPEEYVSKTKRDPLVDEALKRWPSKTPQKSNW
jgi:hypothetical protein